MPARSQPIDVSFIRSVKHILLASDEQTYTIPTLGTHPAIGTIYRREILGNTVSVGLDLVVSVASGNVMARPLLTNVNTGLDIDVLPNTLTVNTAQPGVSYLHSGPVDITPFLPVGAQDPLWLRLQVGASAAANCISATLTVFVHQ